MKKHYITNYSLDRYSTGSIRKAAFDQRKSIYVRNTNDRPAVFIEQSNKHTFYIGPSKNTQN